MGKERLGVGKEKRRVKAEEEEGDDGGRGRREDGSVVTETGANYSATLLYS